MEARALALDDLIEHGVLEMSSGASLDAGNFLADGFDDSLQVEQQLEVLRRGREVRESALNHPARRPVGRSLPRPVTTALIVASAFRGNGLSVRGDGGLRVNRGAFRVVLRPG